MTRLWQRLWLWALNHRPEFWLLIGASALTRLPGLSHPPATVFDEVYFKQFSALYFSHRYYFDIHPPLGKLLLAGWAWLTHLDPATLTDPTQTSLRLLPALAGIAMIALVYGITRRLTNSRLCATVAGLLVTLNGALIVESRLVLLDSLLMAFILAAMYAGLRWRERRQPIWLIIAGLTAGAAAATKWAGLSGLAIALIIIIAPMAKTSLLQRARAAAVVGLIAAVVYSGSFWIHFQLLNRSGPGDNFMSPSFQATLIGNPQANPSVHLSFWNKFIELNRTMWQANSSLRATHPYGSKWYTWPLQIRPVNYWQGQPTDNLRSGHIYLFSDPLIWWLATLAVGWTLIILLRPPATLAPSLIATLSLLLLSYGLNWLPFSVITRVAFLYHYLTALVMALIILAITATLVIPNNRSSRKKFGIGLAILASVGFLYYLPITYGWSITNPQLNWHLWLPSWR